MDMVKRVLGIFLIAVGVAVAVNLILTPVYHDGSPDYPVWSVLNWFMAAAAVIVLAVNVARKRALKGSSPSVTEYLRVSFAYYGAIVLAMLFFWEWFWTLNPDSETGDAVVSHIVYFPIMDALFTCIALATGSHLWGSATDD